MYCIGYFLKHVSFLMVIQYPARTHQQIFPGLPKLTHKLIGGESNNFNETVISSGLDTTRSPIPGVGSTPITATDPKVNILQERDLQQHTPLNTLFSNPPHIHSSPKEWKKITYPYKTKGKIKSSVNSEQ
jgi:hypothetical protein